MVNYELGIDESHEEMPKRFYEPFKQGPLKGVSLDRDKFIDMKQEYYKFMGWDETGKPTEETLKKLNI